MLKLVGLLAALIFSGTTAFGQTVLADGELLPIPPAMKTLEGMRVCGPYILLSGEGKASIITVVLPSPSPVARLMAPLIPLEIVTVVTEQRSRPRLRWTSGSNTLTVRGHATVWISEKDLKEAHCLPQGRPT